MLALNQPLLCLFDFADTVKLNLLVTKSLRVVLTHAVCHADCYALGSQFGRRWLKWYAISIVKHLWYFVPAQCRLDIALVVVGKVHLRPPLPLPSLSLPSRAGPATNSPLLPSISLQSLIVVPSMTTLKNSPALVWCLSLISMATCHLHKKIFKM